MHTNIQTTQQSSTSSSSSRNLIFVAGLPSKISKRSVEAYFHQFGSYITVHFVSSAKMKRHDPLESDGDFLDQGDSILPHRGFCLLEVFKKQTYNTVLEVPVHVLYGRRLFCSPLKSGFDLAKHNASTCGRRTILKKVPLPIEERYLVRELEQIAGPVESIYQFVSDCPTKTTKQGIQNHQEHSAVQAQNQATTLHNKIPQGQSVSQTRPCGCLQAFPDTSLFKYIFDSPYLRRDR